MIRQQSALILRFAHAQEQSQVEAGAGDSGHPACLAQVFVHLPLYPTTVTKIIAEILMPHFHQRSYPGDEHSKNPFQAE